MRKQLCKDHSENGACYDLCHLSKINRNTEFISGRMRIISYVSLAILFLPVYTMYKVQRRFENRIFPFRECTNYTLDITEQNYATYAVNAVTSRRVFLALNRRRSQNVLNLTTTAYIHTLSVRKQTA